MDSHTKKLHASIRKLTTEVDGWVESLRKELKDGRRYDASFDLKKVDAVELASEITARMHPAHLLGITARYITDVIAELQAEVILK